MMESQFLAMDNRRYRALAMAMIVIIIGAAFTAWCVDASFEKGPLSSIPNYDDVAYFLSATKVLEAFRSSGFHGVAEIIHKRKDILHSPYSTMLATTAFAVLGYQDASPYIFNYLAILLYLFFLWHTLRDLPFTMRCAMMGCFLALPFATMAVVEFRPDLCWSILIGFCAVFGISSRTYFDDWRQPVIHAVMFAAALLVKPATFAMTIGVFGLSVCYRTAMEWLDHRELSWRDISKLVSIDVFVIFIMAGPYFIFFGYDIWSYFWKNLFGANKAIWVYQGDWLHQVGYYFASGAAASNLGYPGWIIGLFFVAGALAAMERRDVAGIKLAGGVWGIVMVVYFINTLAGMKSAFVGGAFYATFIFGSACLLNNAVMNFLCSHPQSKHLLTLGAIVLMIFSVMLYHWPQHSGRMMSKEGRNFKYVGESVIREIARLPIQHQAKIIFTQTGPVISENVEMWFIRHNIAVNVVNLSYNLDIGDFKRNLSDADIVFLQDPEALGTFLRLPSESFQVQFRRILSEDPRFKLLKRIEALDGKKVYIYTNKRTINQ